MEQLTTVTQDGTAEQGLIGSALQGKFTDIAASGVSEEHFFQLRYRALWKSICDLDRRGSPIDSKTVAHAAQSADNTSVQDVYECYEASPSAHNWSYFASILEEKRKARAVQEIAGKLADLASSGIEISRMVSEAESMIFALTERVATTRDETRRESFQRIVEALEDAHSGKQVGVPTGIRSRAKSRGGLRGGQLITRAARPAVGKSALAGNIAEFLVMSGIPVGFFSYEMTSDELNMRMLCSLSDTNLVGDILNGGADEQERLRIIAKAGARIAEVSKAPLEIVDDASLTVDQIRSHARRLVRDKGVKLIVVDYMQLVKPSPSDSKAQRYVQVGNITAGLKQMAMELKLPVLGLAQVNRETDRGEPRRPRLSDLRESGSIEQDSDVVMFLYIDDPRVVEGPKMALKLFVAKNRSGRVGETDMVFIRNKIRFEAGRHPLNLEWINGVRAQL